MQSWCSNKGLTSHSWPWDCKVTGDEASSPTRLDPSQIIIPYGGGKATIVLRKPHVKLSAVVRVVD